MNLQFARAYPTHGKGKICPRPGTGFHAQKFARRPRRRRGFSLCWLKDLSDAGILERLVAVNAECAAEEARGVIYWLRPENRGKQIQPVI